MSLVKILLVFCIVFGILAIVVYQHETGSQENTAEQTNATGAPEATVKKQDQPTSYFNIGDSVEVRFGARNAYVGISKQAMSDLVKYVGARDGIGIDQLLATGEVFDVPNGTVAKYIGVTSYGIREIRILEGKHYGRSGFVVKEALHKMQ